MPSPGAGGRRRGSSASAPAPTTPGGVGQTAAPGNRPPRPSPPPPTPLPAPSRKPQVLVPTDRRDSVPFDQHGGVLEHLEVRHFTTTAGTGGSAARHDLPGADEEGLQSCASPSRIGRRIPWGRAASPAFGYPAAPGRAPPLPGSLVGPPSSRRPPPPH